MRVARILLASIFLALVPVILHAQDAQTIRQAQQKLKSLGHYGGDADGDLGAGTEAAIKRYQEANNLPVTGKLDEQTKQSLGLVAATASPMPSQEGQSSGQQAPPINLNVNVPFDSLFRLLLWVSLSPLVAVAIFLLGYYLVARRRLDAVSRGLKELKDSQNIQDGLGSKLDAIVEGLRLLNQNLPNLSVSKDDLDKLTREQAGQTARLKKEEIEALLNSILSKMTPPSWPSELKISLALGEELKFIHLYPTSETDKQDAVEQAPEPTGYVGKDENPEPPTSQTLSPNQPAELSSALSLSQKTDIAPADAPALPTSLPDTPQPQEEEVAVDQSIIDDFNQAVLKGDSTQATFMEKYRPTRVITESSMELSQGSFASSDYKPTYRADQIGRLVIIKDQLQNYLIFPSFDSVGSSPAMTSTFHFPNSPTQESGKYLVEKPAICSKMEEDHWKLTSRGVLK